MALKLSRLGEASGILARREGTNIAAVYPMGDIRAQASPVKAPTSRSHR